jgi:glycosyltransferase involved in cell wall biosynthesis
MAGDTVLFVLKGYPRLSETFIAEEIHALERAGMSIRIVALRRPTDSKRHPVHAAIRAPVVYLPEYLHDEPGRMLRGLFAAVRRPGFVRALRAFLSDLGHDPTRNRIRRFGQAAVLAAELPDGVSALHAHFIHTPASVTRYAAIMTGLAWSCSAHAKDIWTSPDHDLAVKLRDAAFVVTCTRDGRERLQWLAPAGRHVTLSYHGLDLGRFRPLVLPFPERDGGDPAKPVRLLTVARAVEKKGLDTLIDALALLPAEFAFRWTHIGGGALAPKLRERAGRLALTERVEFRGAADQAAVIAACGAADIFVLPCRVAGDGDRDGLPNVLVEAASLGLACISTPVGGVPELIDGGRNGVLVPPDDPAALAAAILALGRDPARRQALGREASRVVAASFDRAGTLPELLALFAAVPRR